MTFPGLLWGCESSAWIYWWIWRLFSHLWRIGFQLWGGSIKPLERWCCMCFKHWKWSVIPPFTFRILETRLAQRHCCCILRSRVSSWTDVYSQRHWNWNRQRRRSWGTESRFGTLTSVSTSLKMIPKTENDRFVFGPFLHLRASPQRRSGGQEYFQLLGPKLPDYLAQFGSLRGARTHGLAKCWMFSWVLIVYIFCLFFVACL